MNNNNRELSKDAPDQGVDSTAQEKYTGPDRRTNKERRTQVDRRDLIRFEEKDDRRQDRDRRSNGRSEQDLWDRRDF